MASVEIVGRGSSIRNYVRSADETWGITLCHAALEHCSLGWWMDDIDIYGTDSAIGRTLADPNKIPCRYMTSKAHPNMPMGIEYPLQEIIDFFELEEENTDWFNNTVAYAVAYAIYKGYDEIHLHGIDYMGDTEIRLRQKECTTFWLGVAMGRGIRIRVNPASFLLMRVVRKVGFGDDPLVLSQSFYGYVNKPKLNYKNK